MNRTVHNYISKLAASGGPKIVFTDEYFYLGVYKKSLKLNFDYLENRLLVGIF